MCPLIGKAWCCPFFLCLGSSGLSGEGNEGIRETLLGCRTKLYPLVNFTSMKLIFWFPFSEAPVSHFSVLCWTCKEWEEWLSFFTTPTISLSYTQWFSPYYSLPLSKHMHIFICKALLGLQFLVFFSWSACDVLLQLLLWTPLLFRTHSNTFLVYHKLDNTFS